VRRWTAALVVPLALGACDDLRMIDQPKDEAYEASPLFEDDMVNQEPVPGTIARGELARLEVLTTRPPLTAALLERGRERYGIFCAPCHSPVGDGDGIIVRRGMPAPPSFHIERLHEAPDAWFMRVVTDGYGAMYSYAARVEPADRWAIIAYIRALQLSRHAEVAELPPELRP
jgi:mono/diheme cytochrome c family protein